MLDQFLVTQKCPKCEGIISFDTDIMPDRTYELVITANFLYKLKEQTIK